MKASLNWLQNYIPSTISISKQSDVDKIAYNLTMAGLEVEGVIDNFNFLKNVVIGRIDNIKNHPYADKLKICLVNIGDKDLSIICGAPNIYENMIVPVALPNTILPDGNTIEKAIIKKITSEGMLCSELELGISQDFKGVMEIKNSTKIGSSLFDFLKLRNPIFEIDLTPNRPDCASIIGIAREIAAFNQVHVKYPEININENPKYNINDLASVEIENTNHCKRYAARVIKDVKVLPSPFWLKQKLLSIGLKPINNIVDITNFVLMETGQPLHAFDLNLLSNNKIIVKNANKGDKFTTLDNKEHILDNDNLMICDGQKPVAIAGVMGGVNSEINPSTKDVLLESAYFDPTSIRKTSKQLGLSTEASFRFERGVDPEAIIFALNRAAELIAEISEGSIAEGTIDIYPNSIKSKKINLNIDKANNVLGTSFSLIEIEKILKSIDFKVEYKDDRNIEITHPSFRVDIKRPEDIIEEIARIWGYNNIPITFPAIYSGEAITNKKINIRDKIKDIMIGLGFTESINYSFICNNFCDKMNFSKNDEKRNKVNIKNPISDEQSVLRTSLIPGLLETVRLNNSNQVKTLKIFEFGNTFFHKKNDEQPDEIEMIAGLLTGDKINSFWKHSDVKFDFYDIKGALEILFTALKIKNVKYTAMPHDICSYTKPGHTAQIFIGNKIIGIVGEVLPLVLKNYEIKQKAFIFDLNFDSLLDMIPENLQTKSIPKFPSISRDVTCIINKSTESYEVIDFVNKMDIDLVESVHLFAIYEGKSIEENKKSISFRINYRSEEKTLEDEYITNLHTKIAAKIIKQFDAGLPT